jgi:two-component system sensor histidine kinase BaeS
MSDTGALSFKMRRFEFTALVSAVADAARSRAVAKGLELKLDEDPEPAWIEGDEQRLRQLLHNLLENAVRYTDTPGQIEISFKQVGKDFTLTISDSAPGVSDTELDQLFDRFYRVEASRNRKTGGSGLGLAICRNIVEAHGGSIVAEAGSLGGISMTVRLKLV